MSDLATLAARFGEALRAQGLAVGADRSARFARAITLLSPTRPEELYWCALATLVSSPDQIATLTQVFITVFGEQQNLAYAAARAAPAAVGAPGPDTGAESSRREVGELASGVERLAAREFADLDAGELARLIELMRRFRLVTPMRRSRRKRPSASGRRVDLRETLRRARRSGGEPAALRRWVPREKPRKLVVLCDISGSMQAQARAMLQLLVCAAGGARAEVFTFATRLTRLTRALATDPVTALRRAGDQAPDWSGGTRIGETLREFLDVHGARGMARGAVVVIVSDGWETGDPAVLGAQMARLSRLAYRIVWVNPRTAKPGYRPLAGGMAAVWPYCDAVVSAHRLDAVDDLLAAVAG
ncbi:vWA domain-containing protein [Amycolatopsis pigmentata]|uniref:VWA domain-containing protein n=1 Tax=Amycolatopsis pigmentata TaxID=450801 RepID=A0ABW5FY84_9PSEU